MVSRLGKVIEISVVIKHVMLVMLCDLYANASSLHKLV